MAARPHNESYAGVWEALFATKEALVLLAAGVDEIRERLQRARLESSPPADPHPGKLILIRGSEVDVDEARELVLRLRSMPLTPAQKAFTDRLEKNADAGTGALTLSPHEAQAVRLVCHLWLTEVSLSDSLPGRIVDLEETAVRAIHFGT